MGLISRVSSRTYRSKPKDHQTPSQNGRSRAKRNPRRAGNARRTRKQLGCRSRRGRRARRGHHGRGQIFGKWSVDDVVCADLALKNYINFGGASAKYLPHSSQRYNKIRFRKAQCPIIERLINSLMMHGRNNGKKMLTMRIVKHAFEIIYLLTGENP